MTSTYTFKMGMFLDECGLPLDQAAELAQELGASYAEFFVSNDELTEQYAARCRRFLDAAGLQVHACGASPNPLKLIHLDEIALADIPSHPEFVHDMDLLHRSIPFAKTVGSPHVLVQGFAWPGEYQNGARVSPTWQQRYATGGGEISETALDKLAKAFGLVADLAEREDINIAIGMMPWNYTNTSRNFRRIMERVGSPRLRCKWGPADNYNAGEHDTITTGYRNLKPYLTSLHLKDVHVVDGPGLEFEYRPIGTGDPDYAALFRTFAQDHTDIVIAVATHYIPPNGTRADAMRTNYANTLRLAHQALAATP